MNGIKRILIFLVFFQGTVFVLEPENASAATGKVNAKETHQTMTGFGASIVYYAERLTGHPNKNEIYDYIFNDLGLDILRLQLQYVDNMIQNQNIFTEIVQTMLARSSYRPIIFMSSWSPPYNLKSNNSQKGLGTLKKVGGKYVYGAFGKYWTDALKAYKAIGIEPDYISLQNEPSYGTTAWETCYLDATEGVNAGYDRALDSAYAALQALPNRPKIMGAEVHGIGYNTFQNYAQYFNHSYLDAYAFHLYHGESDNVSDNHNPDLFNTNLSNIAQQYKTKPLFQTEYDRGDWFNTVWLMHNNLVSGNVSAYLYWALIWTSGSGKGLIQIEDPYNRTGWKTPRGYIINTEYWAFRQYSKYVDAGWKRVTATVDADSLRISAFIRPDGKRLTVVVLNLKKQAQKMSLDIKDFSAVDGEVTRTSVSEEGDVIADHYDGKSELEFAARSISTIFLSDSLLSSVGTGPSKPVDFALYQNHPNPFNPSTTIRYGLTKPSIVRLAVYDALGKKVRTLLESHQDIGEYSVNWDGKDDQRVPVSSGLYVYRLETDGLRFQKKMTLVR